MSYIEENIARLKDMMTTPPMSAAQHAVIMRKKIGQRRLAEDTRDAERYCPDDFQHLEMGLKKMSTTYYLLRTKATLIGNGSYLGINRDGVGAIVNKNQDALRFDGLEAAEQHATQIREELGEFEIELRNTNENTME